MLPKHHSSSHGSHPHSSVAARKAKNAAAKATAKKPLFQVIIKVSHWIRTEKGGILDLRVRAGHLVYKDDFVGSILNPFGKTVTRILSPLTGIVIGVTTAPLVIPGTGIVHVAGLKKTLSMVERSLRKSRKSSPKRTRSRKARIHS